MGTRGAFGVVADGVEKIGYNHFDSYPDGHGLDVLHWVRDVVTGGTESQVREKAINLKYLDEDNVTPNQLKEFDAISGWDLAGHLDFGYIIDASDFPYDGLFCEWGYIVDFDNRQLEVYQGGVQNLTPIGRFKNGGVNDQGYDAISLVAYFSFDHLPSDEDFLDQTAGPVCCECSYRKPIDFSNENEDGTITCDWCLDEKATV
jgi:hypothetical protein